MKEPLVPRVYDYSDETSVTRRRLPHWSQAGALTFITFRTYDSIPKQVLEAWLSDRRLWLRQHAISDDSENWQEQVTNLTAAQQQEFREQFTSRWERSLDDCFGECVLRKPEIARIVHDCLLHFDQVRYAITDFVVMPNHVHLIAAFPDANSMLEQCKSWKHYSAVKINRLLARTGNVWQKDSFDRLIRSEEQFFACRRYIAENPQRAKLQSNEYLLFTDTK